MALITQEPNYQRKSHRVTLPLAVEINGKVYRARDWSIGGVGLEGLGLWLKPQQILNAKIILPMPDSQLALNVELEFKGKHGDVNGFEFHELSPRARRVLRHYIEYAIEGKLDNIEDLVSVVTTPGVASPIEDALNLTELEAEGLLRKFKTKSYISVALGILFLLSVVVVLFYNTTYRIHVTGLVAGNVESVTANNAGIVEALFVAPDVYVDAGQPLFYVEDPQTQLELSNIRRSLEEIDRQTQRLRPAYDPARNSLVRSLAEKLEKQREEYAGARQLFDQRIISLKDYSYVENRLQQTRVSYQRAVDEVEEQYAAELRKLEARHSELSVRKQALLERDSRATVTAPVRGKVFHIEHAVGNYVTPDDVVVLLEKNTTPDVLLKLMAVDALKIRIGMAASVYVPATESKYQATVAAVGYASVNSRATVTQEASLNETLVRLEFTDKSVRLPANTRVNVWIRTF